MAITLRYSDVMNVVGKSFPKATEDNFAAIISNLATNLIWKRYDWRETISPLNPFYLVPNEQDHRPPMSVVPSDFAGLRQTFLTRVSSGGQANTPSTSQAQLSFVTQPIKVVADLPLTHVLGIPQSICYQASALGTGGGGAFRVFPRVATTVGAPYYFINGTYKKRATKITAATLDTLLPFDDAFFEAWISAAQWGANKALGNNKAVAELLPIVYTELDRLAEDEGINLGDPTISPAEPLVPTQFGMGLFTGLYGGNR